jgi:hypothetical protein
LRCRHAVTIRWRRCFAVLTDPLLQVHDVSRQDRVVVARRCGDVLRAVVRPRCSAPAPTVGNVCKV